MLYFAIPAILVFFVGMMISVWEGWDGLVATVWDLVKQPWSLYLRSVQNIIPYSSIAVMSYAPSVILMPKLRFYRSHVH